MEYSTGMRVNKLNCLTYNMDKPHEHISEQQQ